VVRREGGLQGRSLCVVRREGGLQGRSLCVTMIACVYSTSTLASFAVKYCVMCDLTCVYYQVWVSMYCMYMYVVPCVGYHVWATMCGLPCVGYHVWATMCGLPCVGYHVWATMCGLPCVVYQVWVASSLLNCGGEEGRVGLHSRDC
jgi:hypothetical protein